MISSGGLARLLVMGALALIPGRALAIEACAAPWHEATRLEFQGLLTTAEQTVIDLLPRAPPARFRTVELVEFERRLNNLGIFDAVRVSCAEQRLRISVREKWTLVPAVDFATGQTLADSYALLGITEYNFLGTANQLSRAGQFRRSPSRTPRHSSE